MHCIIFSVNKNCLPPSIHIGLHRNIHETEEPSQIPLQINPKIESRCDEKDQRIFTDCVGTGISPYGKFVMFFHMLSIKGDPNKFGINRRVFQAIRETMLAYIMCFAKLEVNRTFYGENYDFGYIQLEKNEIVAKLRGQDFAIRGMKVLKFDASKSYHKLAPWNGFHELNISWTLVQSKQQNQVNSTAMFGEGVKVAFNISDLDSTMYNVTLVVSYGKNNTMVQKQVQILDKPKVYVRYAQNI